jgi:hypothetical protein
MIVDNPVGRPFRLWLLAAGFFYAQEYHFPGKGKKVYLYGGCMNRRFDKSFRISHHLLSNGECSRHPFVQSAVNA